MKTNAITNSQDDPEPSYQVQPAQPQQHETQVIELPAEEKFYTKFEPEILNLSPDRKSRYATLLRNDRNEASIMKIMGQLGFRYTNKSLSFVHRNIEYHVDKQAIAHTWIYLFELESKEDKDAFNRGSKAFLTPTTFCFLPKQEKEIIWDTQDACYLPFQNGVLKVTAKDRKLIDYARLQFVVKLKDIIPRKIDLDIVKDGEELTYLQDSDFYKLLRNVSSTRRDKKVDENLFQTNLMGMARTVHTHFNETDPAMVIWSEQTSEGEFNAGGTGKGIIGQGIRSVRPAFATIDGKNFRPDDQFAFDAIIPNETKVVSIDETDNFGAILNRSFSMVTEGVQLKRKYKDTEEIPVNRKPKFMLSANSLKLPTTESARRRIFLIPLTRYYNEKHKPIDDFGRTLFGPDWKAEDWNKSDFVFIYALQSYFRQGYNTRPMPRCNVAENLVKKQYRAEVGENLNSFLVEKLGKQLDQNKAFQVVAADLLEEYNTSAYATSDKIWNTKALNTKLLSFAAIYGWTIEDCEKPKKINGKTTRVKLFFPPEAAIAKPLAKAANTNAKRSKTNASAKKVTKVTKKTII